MPLLLFFEFILKYLYAARASEICLTSLSDPSRARMYARRCLIECYGDKMLNFLRFVESDSAAKFISNEIFNMGTLYEVSQRDLGSISGEFPDLYGKVSEGINQFSSHSF